jgi:hypothetical protein
MRPHGRADINVNRPQALGVCDRCGFLYNHNKLMWQTDWRGPQVQNLRVLVCDMCLDTLQQNGQRTIVLPGDPIPINNARPEAYIPDSNPLSGLGADPSPDRWRFGSIIGSMTHGGGPQAAFDKNVNKPAFMSSVTSVSNSSYQNYVGINWSAQYRTITPSSIGAPVITHTLRDYVINAPNDATFGSTSYVIQGSQIGSSHFAGWTTLASGSLNGTVGEQSSGTAVGARYQFHRVAFYDNGTGGPIGVAQVAFSVADGSSGYQGT